MRRRFALRLALLYGFVVGLFAITGVALWAALDPPQRATFGAMLAEHAALLATLAFLLLLLLGGLLQWWTTAYPGAALRLGEEVSLIHTVNSAHRVASGGAPEMRELGSAINAFADAHNALRRDVEARVEESHAHLEQEKNRLAALMSELAQSALVCNAEGRILLYNTRAGQLLGRDASGLGGAPVGLGRSVFGILDKSLIVHALDQVRRRLEQGGADPVAQFVTAREGQLLRVQMAPVLDASRGIGGFVLILEDITRAVETSSRRDLLLHQLTEGTRASLGNIRAAVETVQRYPDMDAERRGRLVEVIRDEAEKLSQRLDESLARDADMLRPQWPLEDMLAADLVFALRRSFEASLGVTTHHAGIDEVLWLSVDSYSLVQALTHVMGRVATEYGLHEITLELRAERRLVRLSLRWPGTPLEPAQLHQWEDEPFAAGGAGQAPTLRTVLERHGSEAWCQTDRTTGENLLSLHLLTSRPEHVLPATDSLGGRPVYYDFDLFSQPGQRPELDEQRLTELSYTVFDTETTGLAPSDGDEIISIGAVRIVNARLLKQECFDQLVNPRRSVRKEAQRVHGITATMLADQPMIEQVLPAFHRFAEDTVLVAHNAAFDMRFLQMKEAQTSVKFIQPVLDTLLLSALVHPGHDESEHQLELIAARLGVHVVGRHTALGDAIVTGEVFIKLIPLLAKRGIHTLGQAREASRKTLYSKLEY